LRRLFWQISTTLDGFMEGPNRELSDTAGVNDPDFDRYASEMLHSIDVILLGRKTYQLFADYWPSATGADADRLNELPKVVFSRMLPKVDWRNSRLATDDLASEVTRLKQQPGKGIALFGSADLAATLIRLGMIDEYRILVSPVLLGRGTPMFRHVEDRVGLKLMRATTWSSGIVALYYSPGDRGTGE
jgi:dihydrofolate reductase